MVGPIKTNIPFHLALMGQSAFIEGSYDTGFIDRHKDALLTPSLDEKAADELAVAAAVQLAIHEQSLSGAAAPSTPPGGGVSAWRRGSFSGHRPR